MKKYIPRLWNRKSRIASGLLSLAIMTLVTVGLWSRKSGVDAIRAIPVSEVERGPLGLHQLAPTFDAGGGTQGFSELLEAQPAIERVYHPGLASHHVARSAWVAGRPRYTPQSVPEPER